MHFHRLIVAAGLCAMVAGAIAATTSGSLEPTNGTWRAYRGTDFTTLACSNSSETAMLACIAADSERRAASTRYQLRYPNRYVTVRYSAPVGSCTGRTCRLEWTYNGPTAEGFRFVYGRSATALAGSVQLPIGSLTSTDLPAPEVGKRFTGAVTLPDAGTWYIASITYGSGTDSPLSNIISRTVQ